MRDLLVVEDDQVTRDTYERLFVAHGLDVEAASDPGAAEVILARNAFRFVLLDMYYGEHARGLELLERIKAAGRTECVVVVTGFADTPITVKAVKLGAANVLEKPIDGDTILEMIRLPTAVDAARLASFLEFCAAFQGDHIDLVTFVSFADAFRTQMLGPKVQRLHKGVRYPLDERLRSFITHLEAGTCAALSRNESAWGRQFGIDPAHFGRLLATETGLTFRMWRRAARVSRAAHLLMRTDYSAGHIAECIGCEHSQLTREFKEFFGCPPVPFRNHIHGLVRRKPR